MNTNQFGVVDCATDLEIGKGIVELAKESRGVSEDIQKQPKIDERQQPAKYNQACFESGK